MSDAEDRQALAELVAAYARGCDRRRPEEVASLYTDDGGFAIVDTGLEPMEISGHDRMVAHQRVSPRVSSAAGPSGAAAPPRSRRAPLR